MSRKGIFAMAFFFAASACATSFTFGESLDVDDPHQIVQLVIENLEYCTLRISNDRIFLKPNLIYPTDEGVFLRINQFDLVRLPHLYSNEEGCYIDGEWRYLP